MAICLGIHTLSASYLIVAAKLAKCELIILGLSLVPALAAVWLYA